jgi:hypothetical protein
LSQHHVLREQRRAEGEQDEQHDREQDLMDHDRRCSRARITRRSEGRMYSSSTSDLPT